MIESNFRSAVGGFLFAVLLTFLFGGLIIEGLFAQGNDLGRRAIQCALQPNATAELCQQLLNIPAEK